MIRLASNFDPGSAAARRNADSNGALAQALRDAAAAAALKPQGVLIFTLEQAEEGTEVAGYRLNPHGRYSHTQTYVADGLEQAGFSVQSIARETLRLEVRQPVSGFVVTARKTS